MVKSKFHLAHFTKHSFAVLVASLLSGCAMTDTALEDTYQPYGGSDNHPITVVKGPVTMEVSSAQGTLQPPQINAVNSFVHQSMQAGVTPITVARPTGAGNSARVAREVASLMVQQGVPRNYVRFAIYRGGASAPVRLSYVSIYAKTEKCGDWPTDATDTEENLLAENHGCAVQANIAAEIANPETLVIPAAVTPIPAAPRVAALTAALAGPSASGPSSSPATAKP